MNSIKKTNKKRPFTVIGAIVATILILALLPIFIQSPLVRLISYSVVGISLISVLDIKKAAKFKNANYALFYYTTLFILGGSAIYIALCSHLMYKYIISMLLIILLFVFLVISYGFVDKEDKPVG